MNTQKTLKSKQTNAQKERYKQIAKDNVEVQIERTNVANVNFNELFEDKLPDDAIELGTYVTSLKEKDNNGDEKAEAAVIKAHESLK